MRVIEILVFIKDDIPARKMIFTKEDIENLGEDLKDAIYNAEDGSIEDVYYEIKEMEKP